MLTQMEDRLSVVKRWGIVRTIQTQSVAEHSFRVARIAERIARDWFGATPSQLFYVLHYALRHDDMEAVRGDFPSIIKDLVDEGGMARRYADQFTDAIEVSDAVKKIVKLADKMEAMYFMVTDKCLGNTMVDMVIINLRENTQRFIDTEFPEAADQFEKWTESDWSTTIRCDPMDRRFGVVDPVDDERAGSFGSLIGGIHGV